MVDLQWTFLAVFFALSVKCQQQPIPTPISNISTSIATTESSAITPTGNRKKKTKSVDRLLYTCIKELY